MYEIVEVGKLELDVQRVCGYIAKEWERPLILQRETYYRWQFCSNRHEGKADRSLVVVDNKNNVLGYMGVVPRSFVLKGKRSRAAELTTWIISEELRGSGYAPRMLEHLKNNYSILVGMGITEAALAVYLRLGFKFVRHIPRYVKVYDLETIRPFCSFSTLGEKYIKFLMKNKREVDYQAEELGDSLAGLALGDSFYEKTDCFDRGSAYLKWRYREHPVYKYLGFRISRHDSAPSVTVILRIDRTPHFAVLHIVDLFGALDAIPSALTFIDEFALKEHVTFSDFYCTHSEIGGLFRKCAWLSTIDDYYAQVPHLFYPVETRTPPTTSFIFWGNASLDTNLSRINLNKGDCDLDRPTINYLDVQNLRVP
jgi:ribosomal protein S18 acetylase RimI-like enzyme